MTNQKVLILAGGFGIGLREIFHGRPKHLVPINGKPFLHYLIKLLRKNYLTDIVLAVGYLSSQIIDEIGDGSKLGVKIDYSIDKRPLGTAGSIKNAQKYFKDDFLIINGDTYLDIDYQELIDFHRKNMSDFTLVGTTKHRNWLMLSVKNRKLLSLDKKGKLGNAGVYVINPKVLGFIAQGEKTSLETELLPLLLKKKKRVFVYESNRDYYDIDSPDHYLETEKKLKKI